MIRESASRERGQALIVVLFILIAVTLLGVAGINDSSLQARISQNQQEYQRVFQVAEAALSHGERLISTKQPFMTEPAPPDPDTWPVQSAAAITVDLGVGQPLADRPRVVIGQPTLRVLGVHAGSSQFCEKTYPVTSFAVNDGGTSRVVLRSYFSVIDDCVID